MRCFVEPSPAGGYFVRLRGEPAPLSRHDTEEEAEAAAAAYERGLARRDVGEHVALSQELEVLVRTLETDDAPRFAALLELGSIDHVDHEAVGALAPDGDAVGVARFARELERPHVAVAEVVVAEGWRGHGLEDRLLARLRALATEHRIRQLTVR